MKTAQRGFVVPALLTLIAILLIGGGGYVYVHTKQANNGIVPSFTAQTTTSETVDWKTYINTRYGYELRYPSDTKIYTSDLLCVRIVTKESGTVFINAGSGDPCGVPTGIGSGNTKISENIILGGKQYSALGWRADDNSNSFLTFNFTGDEKIFITYGVNHSEALTDSEYQTALNSAKEIVSTIK